MHTICHFEIPSTDLKVSAEFYGTLFGWKIEEFSESYLLIMLNEKDSGGLYQVDTISKSQIQLYFQVEDIPSTLASAVKLGGSVVEEKRSIGENGFIGSFKDPLGLQIDIWSRS